MMQGNFFLICLIFLKWQEGHYWSWLWPSLKPTCQALADPESIVSPAPDSCSPAFAGQAEMPRGIVGQAGERGGKPPLAVRSSNKAGNGSLSPQLLCLLISSALTKEGGTINSPQTLVTKGVCAFLNANQVTQKSVDSSSCPF